MMWKFIKSGIEGDCELFGVNIFDYRWENTKQRIIVLDPIYNQRHEISIYNAAINGSVVTFAAGELSNCVYGFYLEE
jgi:hypothetical protein